MRKVFLRRMMIGLLTIMLIVGQCGFVSGCATNVSVATNQNLRIVTSFLPMYIFTANLVEGIDGISLTNMAAPDAGCLHDYQLLPADMIKIESADLFIFNGAGMESFLTDLAQANDQVTLVNASQGIELLPMADGTYNPHVWLSIPLAIQQVKNISRGLQSADSSHQTLYQANEAAYVAKLEALDETFKSNLATVSRREIITFHEAFPYLATEYGLTIAAVIEREPGSEPSADALAATIDLIRQTGIRELFAEPQYSPIIAETIAAETGATIYKLDPIVTGEAAAGTYEINMKENLEVLMKALK